MTTQEYKLSEESVQKILTLRQRYPEGRSASAVLPSLHVVQEQFGYVPDAALAEVAQLLDMLVSEVDQVRSFYVMYFPQRVGKFVVKVCDSISCYLRGSDDLLAQGKKKLGVNLKETTPDGQITLMKIECLAACGSAPCIQVNDEYLYNVTTEQFAEMLETLQKADENPYFVP